MPNYCTVCGLSKSSNPTISLFRLPKEPERRKSWLENLCLVEQDLKTESRVCSRHLRDGNPQNTPSLHLGKEFLEKPIDITPRGKRRASREATKRSCARAAVSPHKHLHSR